MALVQHVMNEDAKNSFMQKFGIAVHSGKWMAMICHIKEDGNATVDCTTYDFPTDRLDFAIRELTISCDERRNEVIDKPSEPLPLAPHLKVHGDSDIPNIPEVTGNSNVEPPLGVFDKAKITHPDGRVSQIDFSRETQEDIEIVERDGVIKPHTDPQDSYIPPRPPENKT